jgi:hypothetical protein
MALVDSNPKQEPCVQERAVRETLRLSHGAFVAFFSSAFTQFVKGGDAKPKLLSCCFFCAMLGFTDPRQCKRIAKATCALSQHGFGPDEIQQVLRYALVNICRNFEYMADLRAASQRVDIALCHMYIAQAILYDDCVTVAEFHGQPRRTEETAAFFARVMRVMKLWRNRVQVLSA